MKILAIETSCDETAIALLDLTGPLGKPEIKVLGNTLLSQAKLHEQYGGVYPSLAKREHLKNLPVLLEKTLKEALTHDQQLTTNNIDFIAVTTGPGLEPALWTGITFAQALGERWGKPVVAVNHMEGHIWSVLYQNGNDQAPMTKAQLELPALALLVSGGHTELVHVKDFGQYEVIGRTLDDAAGEAFDKVARMLGLPYPGGPEISKLAAQARSKKLEASFKLPRPMIHSGNLNFSFSGLKTAVLYKLKSENRSDQEFKEEVALAFEDAVIDVLIEKTRQALTSLPTEVKTLIIAGGVSANTRLTECFKKMVVEEFPHLKLFIPSRLMATDNAIMIALAAYVQVSTNPESLESRETLTAKGNLSINSSSQ